MTEDTFPTGGTKKLSELEIDDDKDWNDKAVTSMKSLSLDSFVKLEGLTADPSVQEGIVWYRGDKKEYRVLGSTTLGTNYSSFTRTSFQAIGLDVDNDGCVWIANQDTNVISKTDQQGSSVYTSFSTPSNSPKGIGIDEDNCIWHADDGTDLFYKYDRSGTLQSSFSSPTSLPMGVGNDSNDCIWYTDGNAGIVQIDRTGSIITSWSAPTESGVPSSQVRGLDVDSNNCVWHIDQYTKKIYKWNQSGSIVTSYTYTPSAVLVGGLGFDNSGYIWWVNRSDNVIYKDGTGGLASRKLNLV